jgi:hypothetical protein
LVTIEAGRIGLYLDAVQAACSTAGSEFDRAQPAVTPVGIILVIALLTIPAAICRQFTYNIRTLIISSMVTGTLLTLGGLWISYLLDLASGATIILLLAVVFVLSLLVRRIISGMVKRKKKSYKPVDPD